MCDNINILKVLNVGNYNYIKVVRFFFIFIVLSLGKENLINFCICNKIKWLIYRCDFSFNILIRDTPSLRYYTVRNVISFKIISFQSNIKTQNNNYLFYLALATEKPIR